MPEDNEVYHKPTPNDTSGPKSIILPLTDTELGEMEAEILDFLGRLCPGVAKDSGFADIELHEMLDDWINWYRDVAGTAQVNEAHSTLG